MDQTAWSTTTKNLAKILMQFVSFLNDLLKDAYGIFQEDVGYFEILSFGSILQKPLGLTKFCCYFLRQFILRCKYYLFFKKMLIILDRAQNMLIRGAGGIVPH